MSTKKRKSGHQHREDSKRLKVSQLQMSRGMSAFLDPRRPDTARNVTGTRNEHNAEDATVPTIIISPSDEDTADTQSSPIPRACSSSTSALDVTPTPSITLTTPDVAKSSTSSCQRGSSSFITPEGVQLLSSSMSRPIPRPMSIDDIFRRATSILAPRSDDSETTPSTCSNLPSTTPTLNTSNSVRQLGIASFTTPRSVNGRSPAAESITPTRAQSCFSSVEVVSPVTPQSSTLISASEGASSLFTPGSTSTVELLSPSSQASPSVVTSSQQQGTSSLFTPRSTSTVELLSPSSQASPSVVTSSQQQGTSSLFTPRSTSTVELLSPSSQASPSVVTSSQQRGTSSLFTPRSTSTVELLSPSSQASPSVVTSSQQRGTSSLFTPRSTSTVELLSPVIASANASPSVTIGPNDIASALLHPGGPALLPDNKKLHLLQQTVKPSGPPDKWPGLKRSDGQMRRITPFCYNEYGKWLTYSNHLEGLFCKYCVIFETAKGQTGQLVTQPCQKFDRLTGPGNYLHDHHFSAQYHKHNEQKAKNFVDSCKNRTKPVTDQLDSALAATKKRNRSIVKNISEVVVLCARMGSAFRGHRDDGAVLPPETINEIVTKQGKFRALIQLYSLANTSLSNHLSTCGANASYVSKTIQNQLIQCMGLAITDTIASEVRAAKFYTVLADETTDTSRSSQMSLSLRYVNSGSIVERFVGFVNPKSLTGEGLAGEIMDLLKKLGLELTNIVGQGYDGAAAMSSEAKGVHGVMKTHCGQQAVYVHCAAHALNLTLMKASEVTQIRNAFGTICSVANFFNSSTVRSDRLQASLDESETTHSKRSLKAPCQTRWVEKHEAVHTVYDLYAEIIGLLHDMSHERGTASRDASSLHTCMTTSDFIVSLCVLNDVMNVTKQLSIVLQSAGISLIAALSYVTTVKAQLDAWRKDVSKFDDIAAKAQKLLGENELSVPRVVGRQTKLVNIPHNGPIDYYRKAIYNPFMNCLTTQFEDRFESHGKVVFSLSSLLPKSIQTAAFSGDVRKSIELYEHLLPGNMRTIEIEFESWKIHCRDKSTINDCLAALDICPVAFYPNINALLCIYATLPVSTATPERTFSALKQIKTYLRSTMTEERLNGLALAYITKHFDVETTVNEMVKHFALENRRLVL